jgi:hypothetical protein
MKSRFLKMNGISCPPKNNPFYNNEKEEKVIKKLKIRFAIILIASHILSFLLYNPVKTKVIHKTEVFKAPKDFKAIQVPLVVHFPFLKDGESAILLDTNKSLLAKKIFISKEINTNDNLRVIYIHKDNIKKYINSKSKIFHAYPINTILSETKTKTKRKNYEIHF